MGFATDILSRYAPLIDDWDAFAAACGRPLPAVVWANPLRFEMLARLNRADGHPVETGDGGRERAAAAGRMLAARLAARGNGCEPLAWLPGAMKVSGLAKPGNTLEHYLGIYHVQEEISLLPPRVLAPAPGERILDLCAAPGGKTAQLAVAAGAGATIVANDVRIDRLRALRSNCERLGLLNVAMTAHDGTCFPLAAGLFDAILLDAPCSCEGNVRDTVGASYELPGEFLTGRSGLQATLFGRAWKLLAPGGRLVYATCTFAPEENEMVLDYSLKDGASIEPIAIPGLRAGPGVTEWRGTKLRRDCANVARFWPHLNDTGGFTVALVRKESR
jgi:16S rRNA C967 or C1407 C5-methylase (RsmB/RsmF family)